MAFLKGLVVNGDLKSVLMNPVVPKSLCFVVTVWMIWSSVLSLSSFREVHQALQERGSPVSTNSKSTSLPLGLTTPLFGVYSNKTRDGGEVKASSTDLKVVGVLYLPQKGASYAIIASSGGEEHEYREGDTLPGGGLIKKITPQGLLISVHGALERLSLPKNALFFQPALKELF